MPTTLNNSAILAGALAVSPLPGSRDATPATQISFVGAPASELSVRSVVGSVSGHHAGRLEAYSQGDGASFVPAQPFAEGERVTVTAVLRRGGRATALVDRFAVAAEDHISSDPEAVHGGTPAEQQSFHSAPALRPPVLTVTASSSALAAGYELVAPYAGPGQAGPMIVDSRGSLVWFHPLPPGVSATNFRVQLYAGRPVLTWWQGDITVHGFGLGHDVILDDAYRPVADVYAGNGLQADLHEFMLTPRGTALITAYDPILCDLTSVGGPVQGAVTDGVMQEVDVRTGLVRRQWTSIDHVAIGESYERVSRSVSWPYDYFHINSINLDSDGSLLISSRNTWTVYDVDGTSGRVQWRLGGKDSTFSEPEQARTAWQHDPRELPDGAISIFDNGSSPTVHGQSRGIVVSLDATTHTATLVDQLTHPPALVAESQGNLQLLGNGDWFVGWGQEPDFSEYDAAGTLLFDAHFPPFTQSYRDFRFAWSALPAHPPAFSYAGGANGGGTVYASWNGATGVAAWRVLAGPSRVGLRSVAQAPRSGFETALALPPAVGPYVAVEALGSEGRRLGVSSVATLGGEAGASADGETSP